MSLSVDWPCRLLNQMSLLPLQLLSLLPLVGGDLPLGRTPRGPSFASRRNNGFGSCSLPSLSSTRGGPIRLARVCKSLMPLRQLHLSNPNTCILLVAFTILTVLPLLRRPILHLLLLCLLRIQHLLM